MSKQPVSTAIAARRSSDEVDVTVLYQAKEKPCRASRQFIDSLQHEGAFVNAYLVETASGVVSSRRAADGLRCQGDAGGARPHQPLHAVLLTHSHPDHYAGLVIVVAGWTS